MEKSKRSKKWIYVLFTGVLLVLALVLAILFMTQGETTYTSGGADVDSTQSVLCTSKDFLYPYLPENNEDSHELRITIILSDNKLDTINLVYKQIFKDNINLEKVSDINSIAIGKHFSADNIGHESIGKKISSLPDASQLTLYAKRNELNSVNSKYFLLEEAIGSYKVENLTRIYNSKGLDCEISK